MRHLNAAGANDARLDALVRRYSLSERGAGSLRTLLEELVSDPLAPTAVRDPVKVIDDHLADSLVALELEQVRVSQAVADLGAGAGMPGLPLAIALPDTRFSVVESAQRKAEFLRRACGACGLTNVEVVNARAEAWPEGLRRFDLVTARALASLDVVVEYAAPLLKVGGALVAWRGRRDPEAERRAAASAAVVGLEPREVLHVTPYPGAERRHLHVMLKVMETPPEFPRRPGMAAKRPLWTRVSSRA